MRKVLTVYAHPSPTSFCHAVLERFDAGLRDGGHVNEVVDLYAIKFDPVLRLRENPNWMDPDAPEDVIGRMHGRERMLAEARGPLMRFAVKRLLGNQPPAAHPICERDLAKLLAGAGLREVARLRPMALLSEAIYVIAEPI